MVKYWQSSHNKTSVSPRKGRINYRLLLAEYFYEEEGGMGRTEGEENIRDHFNEITMKLTFRKAISRPSHSTKKYHGRNFVSL